MSPWSAAPVASVGDVVAVVTADIVAATGRGDAARLSSAIRLGRIDDPGPDTPELAPAAPLPEVVQAMRCDHRRDRQPPGHVHSVRPAGIGQKCGFEGTPSVF